jgi:hypothetical protein
MLLVVTLNADAPLVEASRPAPPSLELLEFLGEFGDDEDGLFGEEPGPPREPAARRPAEKQSPAPPADSASPGRPKVQP